VAVSSKHLVVIGGGAAGFFCAVNAARMSPGLRVTIVEKSGKVLQKVKVSGGGRCNLTHDCDSISTMSKCYPRGERFVKKLFHHFFTHDTIEWFTNRGVPVKTEHDGRMFPQSDSSQSVIDCLMGEANKFHVDLVLHFVVEKLEHGDKGWKIMASDKRHLDADFLCIACGGFPKQEMFNWITTTTGHSISSPIPSLFTFNTPGHPITKLMGVATLAHIRIAGLKWESNGPLLITHWGLSGPAVLRLSAFAARDLHERQYVYRAIINWLPEFNEASLREKILVHRQAKGSQKVVNTEWVALPERLWLFLLAECQVGADMRWADLPAQKQNLLIKLLCGYELEAKGKTTFKDEFVTAGGIDTSEVDASTMASRKVPGLFFAGEILNVDGVTGGYNFQHAWSSGFAAAKAIADSLSS
jgi:predicted Rossmann fold flavoprotein